MGQHARIICGSAASFSANWLVRKSLEVLEIQNQLLDDMKAEFQEFPGRRVYTAVEREGIPPSDADKQPVAPRGVQEEEDRNLSTGTYVITSNITSSVSS